MPTRPSEAANAALPSPFPEGWYFVASRQQILKAGLIEKTWVGEDIVAWCDEEGRVCVAEAFCPHLGSALGPEAGGRIGSGRVICPFHGFEFDTTGQCVATPFAAPPRASRLGVFETQEVAGMIFAWWGIGDRAPQWSLPEDQLDQAGWSDVGIQTLRFHGHPQETTENSVDLAHLRYVHGYDNVGRPHSVVVDGPYLRSRFDFRSTRTLAGVAKLTLDFTVDTHVWGLGYSFVESHEQTVGMNFRLWILATPVDGTLIDLSLASQVGEIRGPKRPIIGLGFLPPALRAPLINRFLMTQQRHDVLQDVTIWRRKRYLSQPRLNRSDGEITTYRDYCAQFYPDQRDGDCSTP